MAKFGRHLLERLHELRPHLPLDRIEVTLLDKDLKPQDAIPRGGILYLKGSKVWRSSTFEQSKREGTDFLGYVEEKLCDPSAPQPVLGYCISKKLNKGYIHRTERLLHEKPDTYYDEAAVHFVHHYLEPLLSKDGVKRSAEDIAKDMRFSIVAHSYNEFPIMVENALRETLRAAHFTPDEQKRIMSQVFILEVGCNHHTHDLSPNNPSFMHMRLTGINDESVNIEHVMEGFQKAQGLWGNPQFVDTNRSAAAQDSPSRIEVLVKPPEMVRHDGEDIPNTKHHHFKGYVEAMPERAKLLAQQMFAAKELTGSFDFPSHHTAPAKEWLMTEVDREQARPITTERGRV
jgi:hypothetical protein